MPFTTRQSEIAWFPSVEMTGEWIAPRLRPLGAGAVSVVPASLGAPNQSVSALRSALRIHGIRTSSLVPRAPVSALVPRRGGSTWTTIRAADRTWRMDARLLAASYVSITMVDATLTRGPFVLDLPSRFLHPRDRVALAARPDRDRALADIAAAALPTSSVVLTPVAEGWLALVTSDPITAELWSLAAAERFLDRALEMQGPWEDPTVQRATELELGARYPGEVVLTVHGDTDLPVAAQKLLYSMSTRLGATPRTG